ncbi:MAG: AAA family ATPase, partial [Desulfobacterales bacterium]
IMAIFGAPIALEDAPQRAVRSSLAIHREIANFNKQLFEQKRDIAPIKMRIGIHTGPVVVGTVGNDLRVEFKAVGDTVNLASRIESFAEPGTTLITENTLKLTEGLFRIKSLGKKRIKGKEESIIIYRVIASSTSKTRFDASAERGLTPFIGRERELELLEDCFERTKGERGQAVSIVAEAGIGKSRILYEFRNSILNENVGFFEGKCLSYSRGVAYNPIIDILKSSFGILDSDDDSEITEKLKRGLETLKIAPETTLPYFLDLFSVKGGGIEKILISPDEKKERTKEAFKKIVLKSAELQPLVIAIEDLHWIDQSSEDTLKDTLESISGSKVLLIFTYRPEYILSWGARSYHSQISLNRLSNRETVLMVSHLLSDGRIGNNLEELILEKTEGVPFFIEEFIKSLKDLKLLQTKNDEYSLMETTQQMNIPSTIQDVIMARVDSLPEDAKDILQTGSAIEREFSYELIKRITGLAEQELLSHLSLLKNAELLYEKGIFPQSKYVFKHALTQDVVYESILKQKKNRLHETIGSVIEELSTDNIERHYGILAKHFIEAENYEKGAKYSELANRIAYNKSAYKDAIDYARKRIFCLERLPKTEDNQKELIDVRSATALYCMYLNYHIEAKEAVLPIVNLARDMDYQKRLSVIYLALGSHYMFVDEDIAKGVEYINNTINTSASAGDMMPLWLANFFMGVGLLSNCEFDNALEFFNKAGDISNGANNRSGIVFIRSNICMIKCMLGKLDQAYKLGAGNLKAAEQIGDIFFSEPANVSYGLACLCKRMLQEAEQYFLRALSLCEKTKHFTWGAMASNYLANVYIERGEYIKAQDYSKMAISYLEP